MKCLLDAVIGKNLIGQCYLNHLEKDMTLILYSVHQSLKTELSQRESEIDQINETVTSMLNQAPSGSLQELARLLMKMTSVWSDIIQSVDRYILLYETSELQWRQFKGMLVSLFVSFSPVSLFHCEIQSVRW